MTDDVSQDKVLDLLADELYTVRARKHGARAEQHLASVAYRLLTGREPDRKTVAVYVKALHDRATKRHAEKLARIEEELSRS